MRASALAVLGGALLLYGWTFMGEDASGYSVLDDGVIGNLVLVLPALVCFGRAVLVPGQRVVFLLIGLAVSSFAAGNCAYVFHVQFLDPVPYPSLADIGYLVPYPLLLVAVVLLAWPELRGLPAGTFLDGALGALSCAAAGSILVVQQVLPALEGSLFARIVAAAFPFSDLTLTALIAGIVTLAGGRPSSTWAWLGSGVVVFAVADSLYLYRVAEDTYAVGTPLDALWAVGLNLLAVAAVLPYRPGGRRSAPKPAVMLLPNVFALVGVALLVYGSLSSRRLPVYAVVLVVATLLTAVQRTAVGYAALTQLAASRRQARTDELTQLPNRRSFDEDVQRALAQRPPGEHLALIMIDLDGFKAVNDTFGHHAGDELLRRIGPRLRRELREGDVLARLGGDEFGILLRGSDVEHASEVAGRLVAAVAVPFLLEGAAQSTAASAGISICPQDGEDLTVLLQRADAAMFDAKKHGAGVTVYDAHRLAADERMDVREALDRHEFVVHYQPQFALSGQRPAGVEALIRWQHPRELAQYGLAAAELTLEVTESALLVDVERSLRTLDALRDLGVHLSLDDYGTGYCSLTYLRDLPLDEVKIDRSFVMTMTPGSVDEHIAASTVALGHALGLRVVAEGVETETALACLRAMGCDVVQGYLLGRPMPADALLAVPRQRQGETSASMKG